MKADIDIDVKPGLDKALYGVRAIQYDPEKKTIIVHPSGIYVDCGMPVDEETGCASIDYKGAEERGFVKIDLLNNSVYDGFRSKEEMSACLKDPDWEQLKDPLFVAKLPHIGNHFDLVVKVEPKSIEDLADILALIRPGKRHLIDQYLDHKERTRKNLYRRPTTGMWFKKSHSFGYAAMIIISMNRLS